MNSVIFKGNKDGIVIILDGNESFENIKAALSKKALESKKFFANSKTSISFKGRELSDSEENELLDIISTQADLDITFVNSGMAISSKQTLEEVVAVASSDQNNAIFHRGSLRNGMSINHKGSIVVIGDVKAGAELVAEGNIIVLGSLKGVAHAGCSGNYDCFVAALDLSPVQIRISDLITYIPAEMKAKRTIPSLAYVQDRQIYIAPLV